LWVSPPLSRQNLTVYSKIAKRNHSKSLRFFEQNFYFRFHNLFRPSVDDH